MARRLLLGLFPQLLPMLPEPLSVLPLRLIPSSLSIPPLPPPPPPPSAGAPAGSVGRGGGGTERRSTALNLSNTATTARHSSHGRAFQEDTTASMRTLPKDASTLRVRRKVGGDGGGGCGGEQGQRGEKEKWRLEGGRGESMRHKKGTKGTGRVQGYMHSMYMQGHCTPSHMLISNFHALSRCHPHTPSQHPLIKSLTPPPPHPAPGHTHIHSIAY